MRHGLDYEDLARARNVLPPSIYIGPNAFFEANFDQMLEQ